MGTPLLDDDAIEAFFLGTGKSAWEQDQVLLMLAEEVRVAVGGPPPRPHGALLAFVDDAAPAVSVAPSLWWCRTCSRQLRPRLAVATSGTSSPGGYDGRRASPPVSGSRLQP